MEIKRIAIGSAVAGTVLGAAAFASAAFTTHTDSFNVSGHAAEVQAPTAVDGAVVGDLMPGYWNDVTFSVTNPNNYDLAISTIASPDYSPTVSPAACGINFQTDWDLLTPLSSNELANTPVPAGQTVTVTLHDAIGMYAASQTPGTECQGAAVTLPLTVSFTVPAGHEAGLA